MEICVFQNRSMGSQPWYFQSQGRNSREKNENISKPLNFRRKYPPTFFKELKKSFKMSYIWALNSLSSPRYVNFMVQAGLWRLLFLPWNPCFFASILHFARKWCLFDAKSPIKILFTFKKATQIANFIILTLGLRWVMPFLRLGFYKCSVGPMD